jgi:hypothetical protein
MLYLFPVARSVRENYLETRAQLGTSLFLAWLKIRPLVIQNVHPFKEGKGERNAENVKTKIN